MGRAPTECHYISSLKVLAGLRARDARVDRGHWQARLGQGGRLQGARKDVE